MRASRTFAALIAVAATALAVVAVPASASADDTNTIPRTAFYDAPDPLPWAPSGTVVRSEATDDYTAGPATRVLYHSRTAAGRDVAASGVVLTPPGAPPKGGWPVVADAHGASGIGIGCAPSLMRDLYHGDQMKRFLDAGYAVVAPDYAGLGTTGRPEFVNPYAEANDVAAAVRSARRAVPGLSRDWVLWGHSQGGAAALAVAEREVWRHEPGYLGAVVTSPAADLTALMEHLRTEPGLSGFPATIVRGTSFADPRIDPSRLLTPEALARLDVTRTGCLNEIVAAYRDLSGDQVLAPDALSDPAFARYLERNTVGDTRVGGPGMR